MRHRLLVAQREQLSQWKVTAHLAQAPRRRGSRDPARSCRRGRRPCPASLMSGAPIVCREIARSDLIGKPGERRAQRDQRPVRACSRCGWAASTSVTSSPALPASAEVASASCSRSQSCSTPRAARSRRRRRTGSAQAQQRSRHRAARMLGGHLRRAATRLACDCRLRRSRLAHALAAFPVRADASRCRRPPTRASGSESAAARRHALADVGRRDRERRHLDVLDAKAAAWRPRARARAASRS